MIFYYVQFNYKAIQLQNKIIYLLQKILLIHCLSH